MTGMGVPKIFTLFSGIEVQHSHEFPGGETCGRNMRKMLGQRCRILYLAYLEVSGTDVCTPLTQFNIIKSWIKPA